MQCNSLESSTAQSKQSKNYSSLHSFVKVKVTASTISSAKHHNKKDFYEEEYIFSEKNIFKPYIKSWKRSWNDICILWSEGSEALDCFFLQLNYKEHRIEFTIERENKGVLNFLDISIKRLSDRLVTKVYRKDTHTQRYIHWRSNHSKNCKLGVLKGLIHRAHLLCDQKEDLLYELNLLRYVFI